MGFFSSSQESRESYQNALLGTYTDSYRSFAPWAFQTTDPESYLLSIGKNERTAAERAQAELTGDDETKKRIDQLVKDSDAAMSRIQSGEFLSPSEQQSVSGLVGKAFEYQYAEAENQFKRAADYLSGGRGLRMSDTPVAQETSRAYKETLLGLGSARAGAYLDTAMNVRNQSAQQQQFAEGVRQFQQNLDFNKWTSKLNYLYGSGMQGVANVSYEKQSSGSATPSGFNQMTSSFGFAKDVASTAAKMYMGGLGGLAG